MVVDVDIEALGLPIVADLLRPSRPAMTATDQPRHRSVIGLIA